MSGRSSRLSHTSPLTAARGSRCFAAAALHEDGRRGWILTTDVYRMGAAFTARSVRTTTGTLRKKDGGVYGSRTRLTGSTVRDPTDE